jgi:hypothetical protein
MSHFLARLVERARGRAARIEPLVTPRFATTPIVEIASEVEASPPERRDQQPTVEEISSRRAVVQPEAPSKKAEPKTLWESDESPLPPEIVAPDPEPKKVLVPPKMVAAESTVVVGRPQARDRPALLVKNGAVKKQSVAPPPAKRLRSATPVTTTLRNIEHDLLTPNESAEQPPIVRITIGRIDVRATPPAALSRKSPAHSEPKLTLDAYLKSRREGTR